MPSHILKQPHAHHVAGIYTSIQDAEAALARLRNAGIPVAHLSLVGQEGTELGQALGYTTIHENMTEPRIIGNLWSDLREWLLGFTVLVTAGEALILFGPMAYAMVVAVENRAFAGARDVLVRWGMPHQDASNFANAITEGHYLVVVSGDRELIRRATDILNQTTANRVQSFGHTCD